MRRKFQLGAILVLIAALIGWYFASGRNFGGLPAAELEPAPPPAAADAASAAPIEGAKEVPTRSPVADPAAPVDPPLLVESELVHPYLYMLLVRTLDENGLPRAGAQVRIGPPLSGLNIAQPLAEVGGVASFIWRGKEPQMEVDVQVSGASSMQGSRRVRLRAETPTEIAFLGGGEDAVTPTRIRSVALTLQMSGELIQPVYEARIESDGELRMQRFPHPHARFADSFVGRETQPAQPTIPLMIDGAVRTIVVNELNFNVPQFEAAQYEVVLRQALTLRLSHGLLLERMAAAEHVDDDKAQVTVHVRDDRGLPAAGVYVALGREVDGTDRSGHTDEQGNIVLDEIEAGWWEVRAGGDMRGLARERLFVEAPNPCHWDARLDRGARVRGRLLDSVGNPIITGYSLRYESIPDAVARTTTVRMSLETKGGEEVSERGEHTPSAPGELRTPWVDQVSPREDGSFEFVNLPGGLGRLLVLDDSRPDDHAVFVEESVLSGEHEYVLNLPLLPATLRVRVTTPVSVENEMLEVRAIHESTGRGAPFHLEGDGAHSTASLAPGWYRVEIGARGSGWHDLGRHFVTAGDRIDLGTFTPPHPAVVRVLAPQPAGADDPPLGLTFYRRRADLDVRGEPRELSGPTKLLLPAGDYWVFWTTREGTQHKALKLESGVETELDLRAP